MLQGYSPYSGITVDRYVLKIEILSFIETILGIYCRLGIATDRSRAALQCKHINTSIEKLINVSITWENMAINNPYPYQLRIVLVAR